MSVSKAHIITQLKKDILALQGFRPASNNAGLDAGLGPIKKAFPNGAFPLSAVHEFLCGGPEDAAATSGFIAGVMASIMQNGEASVWISSSRTLFPPALKAFGIAPEKIIFVDLEKEKEILWAVEEALKCGGLAAVIAEMQELSFTASRRLQLAVEQSLVTGFILRRNPRNINTTACVSRWKIRSLQSGLEADLPGVGFPRWNVELEKIRNGRPGNWQLEWAAGRFRHISKITPLLPQQQKKTG